MTLEERMENPTAIDFFLRIPVLLLLIPGGATNYLRTGYKIDKKRLKKLEDKKGIQIGIARARYEGIKSRNNLITKPVVYSAMVGLDIMKVCAYFQVGKDIYDSFC